MNMLHILIPNKSILIELYPNPPLGFGLYIKKPSQFNRLFIIASLDDRKRKL